MNGDTMKRARLGEIARAFLRLGFVAFGGAAAHIGAGGSRAKNFWTGSAR
jgi:chromate transport protein ChrA